MSVALLTQSLLLFLFHYTIGAAIRASWPMSRLLGPWAELNKENAQLTGPRSLVEAVSDSYREQ